MKCFNNLKIITKLTYLGISIVIYLRLYLVKLTSNYVFNQTILFQLSHNLPVYLHVDMQMVSLSQIHHLFIDNIFINANIKNNKTDHFPIFIILPAIINKQSDTHHYTKYREIEIYNIRRFVFTIKHTEIFNINEDT